MNSSLPSSSKGKDECTINLVEEDHESSNQRLLIAVRENNLIVVKECLKNGANVDITENGTSSLHYAIENNNKAIVQELINAGADIHLRNNDDKSASMFAESLSNINPKILQLLASFNNEGLRQSDKDDENRSGLVKCLEITEEQVTAEDITLEIKYFPDYNIDPKILEPPASFNNESLQKSDEDDENPSELVESFSKLKMMEEQVTAEDIAMEIKDSSDNNIDPKILEPLASFNAESLGQSDEDDENPSELVESFSRLKMVEEQVTAEDTAMEIKYYPDNNINLKIFEPIASLNDESLGQFDKDDENPSELVESFSGLKMIEEQMTAKDTTLEIKYSPDNNYLHNLVKKSRKVRLLKIDMGKVKPDFFEQDAFYLMLKNATNLFFVDVHGSEILVNDEVVKDRLKKIEKPLIIQCRSSSHTKVYIRESRKELKEPTVLNLDCSAAEELNEDDFIEKLVCKDSFGFALVMKALKSGLIGNFNNETLRDLLKITLDLKKGFDGWKLIDYAIYRDDFLLTRFLSLFDWDLMKKNEDGTTTMEIAAQFASLDTLAALLNLQLPLSTGPIHVSTKANELLKTMDIGGNVPLSIAVKHGNVDNVDFFMRCDPNAIHHRNKSESNPIDLAWELRHYHIVLKLLKADSNFPGKFDLRGVGEAAPELVKFCRDREKLHASISDGNLSEVKRFISRNEKSLLYLNERSESALFTAIDKRKFEIYAYLKLNGADFNVNRDERKRDIISSLNDSQINSLKYAMIPLFPKIEKSYILYLVSRSRCTGHVENFKREVENYYEELDHVPEISMILRVLEYCDFVDIIFDFNEDSVVDVEPSSSEETKGSCDFLTGRIYIGAKIDIDELLGTLAHELTHLAMQTVYENYCEPYRESDTAKKAEFQNIIKKVKETCDTTSETHDIISRVFTVYGNEDLWPSELAVRISHIYAKERTKGRDIIEQQVPELLAYYKKYVLPDCVEFTEQAHLIKPRKNVCLLNQYSGMTTDIAESAIRFQHTRDLDGFFKNHDKKILHLNTRSTQLSSINVYQSLRKGMRDSTFGRYMFFKFDRYYTKHYEICNVFSSVPCESLVLVFSSNPNKTHLRCAYHDWSQIFCKNPHKKIVVIARKNDVSRFDEIFDNKIVLKENEQEFTLNDLDLDTQEKLLRRKVIFQGEEIHLKEIIREDDDDAKRTIDSETLLKLINNCEVKIGNNLTISRGYDTDHYVHRSFYRIIFLDGKKIQKSLRNDSLSENIFILENIEWASLMSHPRIFRTLDRRSTDQKFKELCDEYANYNIHCLTAFEDSEYSFSRHGISRDTADLLGNPVFSMLYRSWRKRTDFPNDPEPLMLYKSSGSVSTLLRYRIPHDDLEVDNLKFEWNTISEHDLLKEHGDRDITIIADEPGMGKSTVLTSLSMLMKKDNRWIIRVDLDKYIDILEEETINRESNKPSFRNGDEAITFLENKLLESRESSKLKTFMEKQLLKIFKPGLVLMFDGFDEIGENCTDVVVDLVLELQKIDFVKIFIATRSLRKNQLENRLGIFSYSLHPFSIKEQQSFLTNFWKKNSDRNFTEEDLSRIKLYASCLISAFSQLTDDTKRKLTGIPLYTTILAKIFQDERQCPQKEWQTCNEFLNSPRGRKPKLPIKFNLCNVYEHFVKVTFHDVYLAEKKERYDRKPGEKNLNRENEENFVKRHKIIAFYQLFSYNSRLIESFLSVEEIHDLKGWTEDVVKCEKNEGIIYAIIDGKPQFIHRTFAEYFAAVFFIDKMCKIENSDDKTFQELEKLMLTDILIRPHSKVMRRFLYGRREDVSTYNGELWNDSLQLLEKANSYDIRHLDYHYIDDQRNILEKMIEVETLSENDEEDASWLICTLKERGLEDTVDELITSSFYINALDNSSYEIINFCLKNVSDERLESLLYEGDFPLLAQMASNSEHCFEFEKYVKGRMDHIQLQELFDDPSIWENLQEGNFEFIHMLEDLLDHDRKSIASILKNYEAYVCRALSARSGRSTPDPEWYVIECNYFDLTDLEDEIASFYEEEDYVYS